jgi:hypothetical protein
LDLLSPLPDRAETEAAIAKALTVKAGKVQKNLGAGWIAEEA